MKLLMLLATKETKRGSQAQDHTFRCELHKGDPTHRRLFKDAPPSVLMPLLLHHSNH